MQINGCGKKIPTCSNSAFACLALNSTTVIVLTHIDWWIFGNIYRSIASNQIMGQTVMQEQIYMISTTKDTLQFLHTFGPSKGGWELAILPCQFLRPYISKASNIFRWHVKSVMLSLMLKTKYGIFNPYIFILVAHTNIKTSFISIGF